MDSFTKLRDVKVLELVVGEGHIAMLTEDGRVCRIRYTEETTPPQPLTVPTQPLTTPTTGREKRYNVHYSLGQM